MLCWTLTPNACAYRELPQRALSVSFLSASGRQYGGTGWLEGPTLKVTARGILRLGDLIEEL